MIEKAGTRDKGQGRKPFQCAKNLEDLDFKTGKRQS
jgi:hypothetical protein